VNDETHKQSWTRHGSAFPSLGGYGCSCANSQRYGPGKYLGGFGNPSCCSEPYVAALAVSGPGTITVAYISGTVTDAGGIDTGPNGVAWNVTGNQFPLQEAAGVAGGPIDNLDSLIGTFVPQSRVLAGGFSAVDGTKNITRVGIVPAGLFFIGTGRTVPVKRPGRFSWVSTMTMGRVMEEASPFRLPSSHRLN
jgi:hypothetical protein